MAKRDRKRAGNPALQDPERARELGRKGGLRSGAVRGAPSTPWQGSLEELLVIAGKGDTSRSAMRSLLRCTLGQLKGDADRAFLFAHAARQTVPSAVREVWIAAGRRSGKSGDAAAPIAVWKAISFDPATLAPGELAVVPLIAADRAQARVLMSYVRGICALPAVRPWVGRVLRDSIELKNGVAIEVHTA